MIHKKPSQKSQEPQNHKKHVYHDNLENFTKLLNITHIGV